MAKKGFVLPGVDVSTGAVCSMTFVRSWCLKYGKNNHELPGKGLTITSD
jgi:hypothetical protein